MNNTGWTGWKTSDFTPGYSLLRYNYVHDASYVYINIPKNASCWMKENFGGYEYNFLTNQFLGTPTSKITKVHGLGVELTYVVILRDPIDRWLSGAAQSFYGCSPTNINFFTNIKNDQLFSQIVFDEHTAPQTLFLSNLDKSKVTWFNCNVSLIKNVSSWMQEKFNEQVTTLDQNAGNKYNISNQGVPNQFDSVTGWTQQQIINELKIRLDSDPTYLQNLKNFYKDDYKLRESVKFYGTR
jgi:hypothetical protein